MNPILLDIAEFEIYLLQGLLLRDQIDLEFVTERAASLAERASNATLTEAVTAMREHGLRCGVDASDILALANIMAKARETIKARPTHMSATPFEPVNGC